VGKTRAGSRLVLDHNVLYQIVCDPRFWECNPEFLGLKDEGERAHHLVVAKVLKNERRSCRGCGTIKTVMAGFAGSFASYLRVFASTNPDAIVTFVDYITAKLGYRPEHVIMYHKGGDGRIRRLTI